MLKRSRADRPRTWLKRSVTAVAALMLTPVGVAVTTGTAPAQAAFNPAGFDFWVNDPVVRCPNAPDVPTQRGDIKLRIFRAKDGNTRRVVYALDGMRAQRDLNGWEKDTNVARTLTDWNINVVMPVGGQSSFYENWERASNDPISTGSGASSGSAGSSGSPAQGEGKCAPYHWRTLLSDIIPRELNNRLGFSRTRNGVFGLSMGGSAALTLAAWHPQQFSYAGSFSGYTNLSAPGMRELLRGAMMMAGGYNADAFGAPWSPAWVNADPFNTAPRLRDNNTRIWISSGSGIPDQQDFGFYGLDVFNLAAGMGLETIGLANTRAFEIRLQTLGMRNYVAKYPPTGVHNWMNWEAKVYEMIPDLSRNIG